MSKLKVQILILATCSWVGFSIGYFMGAVLK